MKYGSRHQKEKDFKIFLSQNFLRVDNISERIAYFLFLDGCADTKTNFLFLGTSSAEVVQTSFMDFVGGVALPFPFGPLGKTLMAARNVGIVLFLCWGLFLVEGDLCLVVGDLFFISQN